MGISMGDIYSLETFMNRREKRRKTVKAPVKGDCVVLVFDGVWHEKMVAEKVPPHRTDVISTRIASTK